jgi:hypothetical protein
MSQCRWVGRGWHPVTIHGSVLPLGATPTALMVIRTSMHLFQASPSPPKTSLAASIWCHDDAQGPGGEAGPPTLLHCGGHCSKH